MQELKRPMRTGCRDHTRSCTLDRRTEAQRPNLLHQQGSRRKRQDRGQLLALLRTKHSPRAGLTVPIDETLALFAPVILVGF